MLSVLPLSWSWSKVEETGVVFDKQGLVPHGIDQRELYGVFQVMVDKGGSALLLALGRGQFLALVFLSVGTLCSTTLLYRD
jgi:hypothetical protein